MQNYLLFKKFVFIDFVILLNRLLLKHNFFLVLHITFNFTNIIYTHKILKIYVIKAQIHKHKRRLYYIVK